MLSELEKLDCRYHEIWSISPNRYHNRLIDQMKHVDMQFPGFWCTYDEHKKLIRCGITMNMHNKMNTFIKLENEITFDFGIVYYSIYKTDESAKRILGEYKQKFRKIHKNH